MTDLERCEQEIRQAGADERAAHEAGDDIVEEVCAFRIDKLFDHWRELKARETVLGG